MPKSSVFVLENEIMNYAWGSRIFIPKLLGKLTPASEPQAELWMGAHPKAPSRVAERSLEELISDDPDGMLGAGAANRFSGKLPFLFKLLAAGSPLSIQTHPDKQQALDGFAREEKAGIPRDAPNRNYRDQNHKPEILCALTDFWGLNGFRRIPSILALLDEAQLDPIKDEIEALRQNPAREGLASFFHSIVTLSGSKKTALLDSLKISAKKHSNARPEYEWILRIADMYPGDIGVLCVLLLNLVKLEPGQAMFCDAGDLHAYLDGFGVELMANSDNVLRGGLTPKHVDVDELLRTLTFEDRDVPILTEINGRYETPVEEFLLSVTRVDGEENVFTERSIEIVLNVSGHASISTSGNSEPIMMPQGVSVVVPAKVGSYTVEGSATLYRASVGKILR